MSGKPYTMREMKSIVEYLVEHKAYNEVKGRKMWMDFASSQMTTRTWQSLKETFLKRILPDIHNPYYKLTMEQARSFREGRNVEAKERNKLEVKNLSDNSNSNNGENQKNGDQPSTSKRQTKEVDESSGEIIESAKILSEQRLSADAVVIEAYYKNAGEIKNVLENNEEFNKNIRDCLKFENSPFNIDAMKVLEDFATESEGSDKEPKMEIDENPTSPSNSEKPENKENDNIDDTRIEISDMSDLENNEKDLIKIEKDLDNNEKDSKNNEIDLDKVYPIIEELNEDTEKHNSQTEKQKEPTEDEDNIAIEKHKPVDPKAHEDKTENIIVVDSTDNSDTIIPPNKTASPKKSIDLVSNSITSDASLPNNQEALNGVTNTQSKLNTSEDKIKPRKRSTSSDTNTCKKVKLDNEKVNNTDKIDEDIANPSTQEKMNAVANDIETISENVNNSLEAQNNKVSTQIEEQTNNNVIKDNPCLDSASLHAEQFNTTKYADPENKVDLVNQKPQEIDDKVIEIHDICDDKLDESQIKEYTKTSKPTAIANIELNQTQVEVEDIFEEPQEKAENTSYKKPQAKLSLKRPEEPTKDDKAETKHEVLLLKSHSDSVSDVDKPSHSKGKVTNDKKSPRKDSLLANMLGFIGGEKRKRKLSHRRSRPQRHSAAVKSDSSDWTSESDSEEYVSPPRGRKSRHHKKYLKPKSARIMSLDEDGGLFVMHGKRMYPVVRDGKMIKNYVALNVESNSEEENSYWRQKYVDEKIRADKLEKRLKEANSSVQKPDPTLGRKSPILQSNTSLRNVSSHKPNNESVGELPKVQENSKESPTIIPSSQEKLKICFTKNNQEVLLEGYWSTLNPALQQVVKLLHTEDNTKKMRTLQKRPFVMRPVNQPRPAPIARPPDTEIETVVIDSEQSTPITTPTVDPEVHEKINKMENEIFKQIEDLELKDKEEEQQPKPVIEDNPNVTKRRGRPRKSAASTSTANLTQKDSSKPEARETRKGSKSDKTEAEQNVAENETVINEKPQEKQNGEQNGAADVTVKNVETISNASKTSSRASKKITETKTIQNRMTTRRSASRKTINEEENVRYMLPSNETKQTNKKAKRSLAEACTQDVSIRSIDSAQGYQDSDFSPMPTKRKKRERKSSHRVLSSKRIDRRKSLPNLTEMITSDSSNSSYFVPSRKTQSTLNSEVYRTDSYQLLVPQPKTIKVLQRIEEDEIGDEIRHFNYVSKSESDRSSGCNVLVEIGSSSNVSLPMSPELSVVENLTISKEMIKNVTLNDTCNIRDDNLHYNKYVMSEVDVSIPLMAGQCELQQSNNIKSPNSVDKNSPTEPANKKATMANIENKSISETINKKLHDLLLESAKKITNGKENMEIDQVDEAIEIPKKTRAKKRCSTPRKRTTNKKKAPVNPGIEEEHMESCSFGGRKSCPPLINIITPEDNARNNNEIIEDKVTDTVKGKKKKDIIKVKIQRPRSRSKDSRSSRESAKTSVLTDSGINETGCFSAMFLKGNESVDLIHNHSDTCLHANECIGDSLEFIENSKSIISLNNSSDSELMKLIDNSEIFSGVPECNDAQDGFRKSQPLTNEIFYSPTATKNNSPINTNSSLITEDLSDEVPSQPSKWYLLSEDDTNTNIVPSSNRSTRSFGANLNQIFTSCAVPNLSTITEKSNDSKKVNFETDGDTNNADSRS